VLSGKLRMAAVFGLVTAMAWVGAPAAHASSQLVVKTQSGKVRGEWSSDHMVRKFLGIPYAQAPVGKLRWQPPLPAKHWRGVRDATAFGPHCTQPALYADMVFRDPGNSEDCLSLNVWAPPAKKHDKLPVMVWIYGGGFITGGTSEPRQDGTNLAHKGVILVSMHYRLGIFGFFAGSGLAAESPHHAAGNYGLMDQSLALRWVHDNIAKFGGDPNNVTIFGESAGSMSVSTQMAAPSSQGLFAHAAGESGGAFGNLTYPSLAATEKKDDAFMEKAFGTDDIAKLRKVSADALLKAEVNPAYGHVSFMPDVDGWYLPQTVPAIFAEGKQSHVPLLAGWNRDEGSFSMLGHPPTTLESFDAFARKAFGANAGEFLKAYAAGNDQEAARAMLDFAGDNFIAYSTWAWIEGQVKTGDSPVYRYYFALGSPGDPVHPASLGAFHSDDIEYVFGTLDSRRGAHWRPEDYALSNQMQDYWTDFAKTGNPNGPDVPKWPKYDASGNWQVMHLQPDAHAEPAQHQDRYKFLERVWDNHPRSNQ
jgi:para-nitrobenzyl esterase